MRCGDVETRLAAYAEEALAVAEQEQVFHHLESCIACRRELENLQQSLQALRVASSTPPPPDLWGGFQSRLAASDRRYRCEQVAGELTGYVEGWLPPADAGRVRQHLESCQPCAAEAAVTRSALDAVERAGRAAAPAPDLWAAFQNRLAAETSCDDVRAALPFLSMGEEDPRALAAAAHLRACAPCASEQAAYAGAMELLDRAAAAPQVDLWPAFAARLEAERQPVPTGPGLLQRLRAVFTLPAAGPALGLAAAALVVVAGGLLLPRGEDLRPVALRVEPQPGHAGPKPEAPALASPVRMARAPGVEHSTVRKVRRAVRPRRTAPTVLARSERLRVSPVRAAQSPPLIHRLTEPVTPPAPVRLASNAGTEPVSIPPAEINSPNAPNEVMPEVVHAVELLVGIQDGAARPFETSPL